MLSAPMVNVPALPVSLPPARTGTAWPLLNPIWRLKNMLGTSPPPAPAIALRERAEEEDSLPLEEEVALLGVEQIESRQVHLLHVVLDLGEVGVVGEVGDQAAREPVLDVEARVAVQVVRDAARCVRSVVTVEIAYGLTSRFIDCAGVSSPTRVPADDNL